MLNEKANPGSKPNTGSNTSAVESLITNAPFITSETVGEAWSAAPCTIFIVPVRPSRKCDWVPNRSAAPRP